MLKRNRLTLFLLLTIAGSAVFSAYSSLDNHFWLSSLVILPFQVGASLYLIYLCWSDQLKGNFRYQKPQQADSNPVWIESEASTRNFTSKASHSRE
jgi:hypothetical protein